MKQSTVKALLALARQGAKAKDALKIEASQGGKDALLVWSTDMAKLVSAIDVLDSEITLVLAEHEAEVAR